tara:strand:- start:173 stop:793 length:621 start_codon:yes stop_codon:yes gene_type:complete
MILSPKPLHSIVSCVLLDQQTDEKKQYYLNTEMCKQIISWSNKLTLESGETVGDKEKLTNKTKEREVNQYSIPLNEETAWLYERFLKAAKFANHEAAWNFDISGFHNPLLLLHYEGNYQHHYDWHLDIVGGKESGRKVSMSVQLSDSEDYEGGELEIKTSNKAMSTTREQGAIALFPSYILHRVKPVLSGERWCVVGWIQGQQHFR